MALFIASVNVDLHVPPTQRAQSLPNFNMILIRDTHVFVAIIMCLLFITYFLLLIFSLPLKPFHMVHYNRHIKITDE